MTETINSGNLSLKEKVDIVFKKFFGKVSSDVSEPFFAEPGLDARPRVFQSQIFHDVIPESNPGDFGPALTTAGTSSPSQAYSLRYYYRWQLEQLTNGNDFAFKGPSDTDDDGNTIDNILQNSVPFNYDTNGGYSVVLEYKDSNNTFKQISFGTGEWVIDPDAGALTFHDYDTVSANVNGTTKRPYLTFYRYTGSIGSNFEGYFTQDLSTPADGFLHPTNSNHTLVLGTTSLIDGNNALEVEGTSKFEGRLFAQEIICTSDEKLKKNVQRITGSLDKIRQLNGVSFQWKKNNKPSFGVLAQNLEKIFPDAVNTDMLNKKSVNYNSVIALLIESVKEIHSTCTTLRREQATLKQHYSHLKAKYDELNVLMDQDAAVV